MGDLVNLRQERKRKARDEKERRAAENRVLHGRSKAETTLEAAKKALSVSRFEAHRLDPPKGPKAP
ncbi:DUF4169 family protein [Nitratireductor soli]|uniref:DUF4169 family protein n=1 Tax=Nitratireductor soli TaxID=1670619 RepID=UPI00065DCA92|nr:DUF4169 family protein [Nitratireductor soli]